jgi:type I restriction enzyme S subunit
MKEGWEFETLGKICQIKPPKSEARNKVAPDKLVSFLPMEDLGIGEKLVRATKSKPLSAVVGSYTYFANGDVLLAKITPCFENGKLGIADGLTNGIGFGSSEYIVFRPDQSLTKEWLFYYLSRESFRVEGAARMSGAVGHKRVAKEFIESYKIPIPPLPEQHRIVRILDETFEGIASAKANAEKNLHNAREVFESYLEAVFSDPGKNWEKCPLEKYIKFIDYRGHTPVKTKSGMRLITAKNVKNGFLQREPEEFVDPKIYDKWMVRGIPKKGDVLFTTEAPLANIAQLDTDEKVLFAQRIIIFQPQEEIIDQTFLKYLLLSRPIKVSIINKGTGATALGIKASLLKQIEIYFPCSLSQQRVLVCKMDALLKETQRLETIYQRKLDALGELKKSLLHQAFNGEL